MGRGDRRRHHQADEEAGPPLLRDLRGGGRALGGFRRILARLRHLGRRPARQRELPDRRGAADLAIALVSNILDEAGRPIGALGDGEMWFHHDNSFTPNPDIATFLYSVELPSTGGNTLFGNGYCAYEALPQRLRDAISGRRVLQVYDYTVREKPDLAKLEGVPHCWQPAVLRHPITGRCALYVDRLMSAALEGDVLSMPALNFPLGNDDYLSAGRLQASLWSQPPSNFAAILLQSLYMQINFAKLINQ